MRYCRIKGKLCVFATEYGYCSFTVCRDVIAWMPLPKVFKENEHESN